MRMQKLGNTDIAVSKVSLGTWGIGGGSVWTDKDCTVNEVQNLLSACEEAGINYIDTAPVYGTGESEKLLGEALKGRRNHFVLQSKCSLNWRNEGGNFHYERDGYTVNNDTRKTAIKRDVEGSLLRMQTDYLDSVIVHYVCGSFPVEETVEGLEELIKEGKIRTYGLSNSQPADLHEYQKAAGLDLQDVHKTAGVSLVQEFFSILSPFHGREYFAACKEYNTVFQTYGVLEEGFLTGPEFLEKEFKKTDIRSRLPWVEEKYKKGLQEAFAKWKPLCEKYDCSYANLVQAWALAQYENMNLLIGMRRPESVVNTAKCVDLSLEQADIKMMEETVLGIQVPVLDK